MREQKMGIGSLNWIGAFFLITSLGLAEPTERAALDDALKKNTQLPRVEQAPRIPEMGPDTSIGKKEGLTPEAFFQQRREQERCRKLMDLYQTKYRAKKMELEKAIEQKLDRDQLTPIVDSYKKNHAEFMKKVEECGDVYVSRALAVSVEGKPGRRPQKWYIADGSYLLPIEDVEQRKAAAQKAIDWLTHGQNYPQANKGIEHLLEFIPQGEPFDDFPGFTKQAYLAVKGEFDTGFFQVRLAYTYFIDNFIETTRQDGINQFQLSFLKSQAPADFTPPEKVFNIDLYGKKSQILPGLVEEVEDVQGMWYVDDQGWIRYYTAAVFKTDPPQGLGVWMAGQILQSTLLQVAEKSGIDTILREQRKKENP